MTANMIMQKGEEARECLHPSSKARFLTVHYTPHVNNTELLTVGVFIFLCEECGRLFDVLRELPRGYVGNGEISEGMNIEIQRIKREREIDHRVREALENKGKVAV